jgi:YjbR
MRTLQKCKKGRTCAACGAIISLMPDLDWIRELCLSLPDATEDEPWPDDLCFKVRGKIFTGMALSDGRFPRLTLKAAPETFHELLEIEGIRTRLMLDVSSGLRSRTRMSCPPRNSRRSFGGLMI